MVPKKGLEPLRINSADFESAVSTIPPLGLKRIIYYSFFNWTEIVYFLLSSLSR